MKICLVCEGVAATELTSCASCAGRLLDVDEIHFPIRRGEEDAAHPLLGTLIDGKYRVVGVLGRGGMGTVFRAVHEVSLVPIALKLLHPKLAARVEYRAYFLAEARKAGRVVHEHTARILDVGETQDGSIYIAQELVPGNTLHEWLAAGDPLSAEILVEILRQLCSALVAAHSVGLVHRDLSPRNVMVEVRQGKLHARILDFGIARGTPERAAERAEAADDQLSAFASPPYAAPEHLARQDVDGRADLYALGVIAYEALCGRVPARGTTAREFAASTLAGDLLPFAPRERVPKSLAHLIARLLQRAPEARPASAGHVLEELAAIASPRRSARLRVGALTALLGATIAFALAFRAQPAVPVLRLAPEQKLDLLPAMPRGTTVQALTRQALATLRFDFGGFDPARLSIEVWQNNEAVVRHAQRPAPRGSSFQLDEHQPSYRRVLDAIATASEQGPVYLKFLLPGAPPLAYAALRLDDEAPQVTLSAAAPAAVLAADTKLRLELRDRQPTRLALVVTHAGTTQHVPLAVSPGARQHSAHELLAALFPPPLPQHDVTLQMLAEDAAGNVGRSAPLQCTTVDLGVPAVLRVASARGDARTLLVGSSGVRLRVELQGREPDLEVSFGAEGASLSPCVDLTAADAGLDATWLPPAGGALPAEGSYQLCLRDRAGNELRFSETFTFATRALEPTLSPLPGPTGSGGDLARGRAAMAAHGVLTDGAPLAFAFVCNAMYRPESAQLEHVEAGAVREGAVRLEQVRDGGAELALGDLADGRYRLCVRARTAFDGDLQTATYALQVRRQPPVLTLPALGARRYLPQLVEIGALGYQGGVLGAGRAWQLLPSDARWLRGSVWFGQAQPAPFPLPERVRDGDGWLPGLQPWPGANVLGVSLRDALDRPVQVVHGAAPAPALPGVLDAGGAPVLLLARFYWHTQAPRPRVHEVRVEYGQPARFVVDAPLPYGQDDGVELFVDTLPCRPKTLLPTREGGSAIEFELPFDRLITLARLSHLRPEQFAGDQLSEPFTLWLAAPDGRYPFAVRARTSRTLLEPMRLGTSALALPESLQQTWMVPVLGPQFTRAWRDAVPAAAPSRATFRLGPPVDLRNIEDCYLQQHEVTRAQYAEVMAALAAQAAQRALPAEALVHGDDPLGGARLRADNLVPRADQANPARYAQLLAAEPERAVTGVDFFQAHVFTRGVGWLLARDPSLFRLPSGFELEMAAFGADHDPSAPDAPLHGSARGGGVRVAAAQAAVTLRREGRGWPPSADELRSAGDVVMSGFGRDLTGLDFGVREWVIDLAVPVSDRTRATPSSADHLRLLEAALESAQPSNGPAPDRVALRLGVVRGLALDELPLLHGEIGSGRGRYPAPVPGVVRVLQMARDGSGVLPQQLDPHLRVVGLRLCGGRAFLAWVRAR
jgi:hypothetical protein